jgi:hypothetical protein
VSARWKVKTSEKWTFSEKCHEKFVKKAQKSSEKDLIFLWTADKIGMLSVYGKKR